jgi:hypothetical protein
VETRQTKCPICKKVLYEESALIAGYGSASINQPCRCYLELSIFRSRLESLTKDLDPAYSKLVNKHFWDLI